jgi:putative ABC transport system substrate-binding protein
MGMEELRAAADVLKLKFQILKAGAAEELDSAFAAAAREHAAAILEIPDPMFLQQRKRIVHLAAERRLPAVYSSREWAAAGGLISLGVDWGDQFRQLGRYIDKILKGAKPATIPVEQASKWELIINLKTARALNLTIPPSLLLRADQVIE